MNHPQPHGTEEKPITLGIAWRRGWRVILMLIVIQLMGSLCYLPALLFPASMETGVAVIVTILLGPIFCYAGFRMFYPEYVYPSESPEEDAIACVSCGSRIPAGADRCAKCGWTYRAP